MESVAVSSLSFKYANAEKFALENISFTLESGDFCVICGESGSGKSTLLSTLVPQITSNGEIFGEISVNGKSVFEMTGLEAAKNIAYVGQSAKDSIVCEKVWQELAFALESLGVGVNEMHARVAEIASFFGLQNCFMSDTESLSGGQQKILSVAAAMAVHPKILLLDEPFSSLDEKSSSELVAILRRINRELGVTVVIAEHKLTELLDLCSKVMILNGGKIDWFGRPGEIAKYLDRQANFSLLPTQLKVWWSALGDYEPTLSIAECKTAVEDYCLHNEVSSVEYCDNVNHTKTALEISNLCFKYEKDLPFVIDNLNLRLHYGEIMCLIGENAAGKSTLFRIICGELKSQLGKLRIYNSDGTLCKSQTHNVTYMPQDVRIMFTEFTMHDELCKLCDDEDRRADVIKLCKLNGLLESNPLDLSGGEQRRLGLALTVLKGGDIILLDEPNNSLDKRFCAELSEIIRELARMGKAVIIVSHDLDFCADTADVCAFMFQGRITSISPPHKFFRENMIYTTSAARIAGESIDNVVTERELLSALCGKDNTNNDNNIHNNGSGDDRADKSEHNESEKKMPSLNDVKHRKITSDSTKKISKMSVLITVICLALIPLTVYFGLEIYGDNAFLPVSLAVIFLAMLPFFVIFERKKPPAKEVTLLAIMTAAAVASRAAFYFLPQVKPVAAIVIITGFAFGAQSGFLVGSLSMLLSNFIFGQGPWTPWQMFAMGLIGFAAGLVGKINICRKPLFAAIFGFLATLVIYGGIVNPSTAIISHQPLNFSVIMLFYMQGLPMDLIHSASTFAFLLLFTNPFMRILDRVKLKFAIE